MKKSMKVATAIAGAAVVVMGGSAFTNSIVGFDPAVHQAFAETTVTGVTVTDTTYDYVVVGEGLAADTGKLQSVTWTLEDDQAWIDGEDVLLECGAGGTSRTPVFAANAALPDTLTCTFAAPGVTGYTNVWLKVTGEQPAG